MPAGDWAQAGRVSSQRFNNAMTAVAINSVDPNKLIQESMKARSAQKRMGMKAEQALKETKDSVEKYEARSDAQIQAYGAEMNADKMARKAGLLAAGSMMVASSFMQPKRRELPNLMPDFSGSEQLIEKSRQRLDEQRAEFEEFTKDGPPKAPNPMDFLNPQSLAKPGQTVGKTSYLNNTGSSSYFDTSKLTDKDFSELAYIVSGEAARGTDDEFGVAASVLNRVQSSQYPNTIEAVGRAPKQYEAVTIGTARYEPELAARLKANVGKINSALETLEGRTDFKGQTMLKNRVAAEDPMFHPSGNFFHYNYQ